MKRDLLPGVGGDVRWRAVATRDACADGRFFYGVATTGVYCRPSCGARLPLRENVRFFDTAAEAVAAGFRPCRRCRPYGPSRQAQHAALVAAACRRLDAEEPPPALHALAAGAGLSPHHFHRVFKAVTGLTPKGYLQASRAERVRDALQQAGTVTEALYDAGYGSASRFYDGAGDALGMAPRAWRRGGADEVIRFAVAACSLGALLVAATDRGVCAIALGDDPDALVRELQDRFPRADLRGGDAAFEDLVARVTATVEQPGRVADLPLDVRGTAFQQRVWQALRAIPPGETRSYAQVAESLGMPTASRAVAAACAANTLAVAVPCHRVVRQDGGQSGYRWGVERKRALLAREGKA